MPWKFEAILIKIDKNRLHFRVSAVMEAYCPKTATISQSQEGPRDRAISRTIENGTSDN